MGEKKLDFVLVFFWVFSFFFGYFGVSKHFFGYFFLGISNRKKKLCCKGAPKALEMPATPTNRGRINGVAAVSGAKESLDSLRQGWGRTG